MPLYEFECKSCDSLVEVLVRSASEIKACPDCGEANLQRVFSVPSSHTTATKSSLPMAGGGDSCGAPRCCGGGC
ncbi:MAG: zinc ribbon domain-containing protein [Rubripirellula sp.]|nr:transcriptional regulator [Rhodopirellula sp.]MCH1439901.1 zinc ribbon domain-containing protein [Rubripirellula sp.]OUX05235.1 MAG: transcriptional regulator [Planctomycetaceae bacterium TMED240]